MIAKCLLDLTVIFVALNLRHVGACGLSEEHGTFCVRGFPANLQFGEQDISEVQYF